VDEETAPAVQDEETAPAVQDAPDVPAVVSVADSLPAANLHDEETAKDEERPPCCLPFLRMPQPWPCRSYIYNIMYKQPAAVPEDEETPAVAANVFYICRYLQQNGVFIC
jgi:hypothetical protein